MPVTAISVKRRWFRWAIAFEGGLVAVSLLASLALRQTVFEQLLGPPRDFFWGMAATAPLALALVGAVRYPVGPLRGLYEIIRRDVSPLFAGFSIAEFALVSLMAGLGEEMFFRGLIQQAIVEHASPWLGVAIASLVFGLLHALSLTYAALAAAIGAYFGILTLATGNLIAAIVAHAAYDFFALWYLCRRCFPCDARGFSEMES